MNVNLRSLLKPFQTVKDDFERVGKKEDDPWLVQAKQNGKWIVLGVFFLILIWSMAFPLTAFTCD